MPINELRAIATFAKAVELGSLRKAAVAQGVSPQAASQALAQLEQHLGVRLLHRTTRNLALTDEGRQLLEATQPALGALERALEGVRQARDEVAGPLRIVGPQSSFAPVIWPVIDAFCREHPDVLPDVQLDDSIGNWVEDRVDVGFRIGTPPQDGLIARRLLPLQLLVCASPDYVATHGAPQSLDELTDHRCSVFRHPGNGQVLPWFLAVDGQVLTRHVAPALATNDADLELHAVLSGQVVGQLSSLLAAPFVRSGRLVPVLTAHITDQMAVYMYYGNRTQPTRVKKFVERVAAHFSDPTPYWLSAQEIADVGARARQTGPAQA